MFTTTTSGVMVKTQPAIHLSFGTLMRLAIPKHAQKSGAIIRQVKQIARPITKQYTKASQLNANQTEKNRLFKETRIKESENKR